MRKTIDLTGQRFGRLTAEKYVRKNKHGQSLWLCKCDCGDETIVSINHLRSKQIKSCGCLRIEKIKLACVKHGHAKKGQISKTYLAYRNMVQRCDNYRNKNYKDYGGRGITICYRWSNKNPKGFKNFLKDIGKIPQGYELDRIDNNKLRNGYSPKNCRLVTHKDNCNNRRIRLKTRLLQIYNYEKRLRSSLVNLKSKKINHSKHFPYNSKELCDHLNNISKTQNNRCPMCHISYKQIKYDVDHIIPTSSARTKEELLKLFDLENLSPLCFKCNRWIKKDKIMTIIKTREGNNDKRN